MNPVGIVSTPCPSRSPDGDACLHVADHLDAHRRDTDGRQWTGGVYRPAAWVVRRTTVAGPPTGAWGVLSR